MRNTTAHAAALEASYLVPRSVIRDSCTKLKQLSLASVAIWKEATAQSYTPIVHVHVLVRGSS